eukprot:TRINITY_DN2674_c0_g1_i2.p2 TRINITY_DN2674_c0_g1~~TRINITY_DN2674_c0_g1_i2.p2  ORF type:complete len:364 (+),score=121.49 TRINITY_DN2674_c0_g1_i2:2355-3446(+)
MELGQLQTELSKDGSSLATSLRKAAMQKSLDSQNTNNTSNDNDVKEDDLDLALSDDDEDTNAEEGSKDDSQSQSSSDTLDVMGSDIFLEDEEEEELLNSIEKEQPFSAMLKLEGISPSMLFLTLPAKELAKQITMRDFNIYKQITSRELLDLAWSKPALQHRAPNVLDLIKHFNTFSNGVASAIVSEVKLKDRSAVMGHWINVAGELFAINNFHGVMAINAAITVAAVYRMKHTRNMLTNTQQDLIDTFKTATSPDNSWKQMRTILNEAKGPVFPYIGMYLSDLTFTDEGNPDRIGDMINFTKYRMLHKIIAELRRHQNPAYAFPENPKLLMTVANLVQYDEQALYSLSLLREPRGSSKNDVM